MKKEKSETSGFYFQTAFIGDLMEEFEEK